MAKRKTKERLSRTEQAIRDREERTRDAGQPKVEAPKEDEA